MSSMSKLNMHQIVIYVLYLDTLVLTSSTEVELICIKQNWVYCTSVWTRGVLKGNKDVGPLD